MNLDHLERRFTDISYFRPEEWHWDFDDGTTYDGQHPGVHEFPGPGEYYVCLTVSNEFAEHTWCDWVVIDSLPTSVREITTESDFRLYPNPGTGEFTIELDDPLSTSSNLTVIDMLGREVHREVVSSGMDEIQLSLSGLPSGRYAVVLRNGEVVLRGSLILLE
ncbi:MAG: T9SS C-terminal target domain-containing protein [Saprospirales bacterium]|nr:MAG: T9SS C-terminal target domain-containing protein [Saprospirales bacterium]